MKIIIFGSTYLSAITAEFLLNHSNYKLIGYVPNKERITIPGKMPIPEVSAKRGCDLILSLNYDQIIQNTDISFNAHTGLLPEYGGVDILYHTIKNKAREQGLTFHKITNSLDHGPIISRITYPVFSEDTIETLYRRMSTIYPFFVLSSLKLLETIPPGKLSECYTVTPHIYKSSQIEQKDIENYRLTGKRIKEVFKN